MAVRRPPTPGIKQLESARSISGLALEAVPERLHHRVLFKEQLRSGARSATRDQGQTTC